QQGQRAQATRKAALEQQQREQALAAYKLGNLMFEQANKLIEKNDLTEPTPLIKQLYKKAGQAYASADMPVNLNPSMDIAFNKEQVQKAEHTSIMKLVGKLDVESSPNDFANAKTAVAAYVHKTKDKDLGKALNTNINDLEKARQFKIQEARRKKTAQATRAGKSSDFEKGYYQWAGTDKGKNEDGKPRTRWEYRVFRKSQEREGKIKQLEQKLGRKLTTDEIRRQCLFALLLF
ncbi:unnamed protein product, partial [marine sediment metagenome]